jgi:outer membrane protein assembly factor BamB
MKTKLLLNVNSWDHTAAAAAVCVFLALLLSQQADGAALSYFRADGGKAPPGAGPLPEQLDSTDALRWRVEMDPGHSTPAVCGSRIYLTCYRSAAQELATVALSADKGEVVWRQSISVAKLEQYHPANGSPAPATPACDGERVYVFFGSYGLVCYSVEGRKLWERRLGPFQDEYGASSSPVLVDDKVVLCEDHDVNSFLAAWDCATGRSSWKVARPNAVRSYSTPVVWTQDGHKQLLVAGALELAGYDPSSGERLWWVDGLARIVIPVPAGSGDMVYMASWSPGGDAGQRVTLDPWATALSKWDRNHDGKLARSEIDNPDVLDRFVRMDLDQSGDLDQAEWERHAAVFRRAQNAILALKPSGRGDLTDRALVWKYQRGIPYVASPLEHNGIIWMVKDGGIVTKLDAASGRVLQDERLPGMGPYFSSPVSGDGKVYFASERGTASVVADQPEWRILSSHDFHEKIYATPVLDGDRLYIRTESALYCFTGLPKGKSL